MRFQFNALSQVTKMFVTSGRTSKAQNISTFNAMALKKLTCGMDNY